MSKVNNKTPEWRRSGLDNTFDEKRSSKIPKVPCVGNVKNYPFNIYANFPKN